MKVLVLGGTQFFGKRLVQNLINDGHEVTVLSRGNWELNFKGKFQHLKGDRNDPIQLRALVDGRFFDVIFDQICFDFTTAKEACEVFEGKTNHYVFTSSQSVYEPGENISESYFDPSNHQIIEEVTASENYAEAKRQAEVGFLQNASFKTTFVRFPIVVGEDDVSKRFLFHTNKIHKNEDIFFPNLEAKMSFIYSGDAANALKVIAEKTITGPINCCSDEPLKLSEFVSELENLTHNKAILALEPNDQNHSPYGIPEDWYMNNSKAKSSGISFLPVKEILKLSYKDLK